MPFAGTIAPVREEDLAALLPLMRGYCDFYEVAPGDDALVGLSRALLAAPERDGIQLLARDGTGAPVGFATIYWSWSTTDGPGRLAIMNDLFVAPQARGTGVADALIAACRDRARAHGAIALQWETAPDNTRAQAVYDRAGAVRSQWLTYTLPVDGG